MVVLMVAEVVVTVVVVAVVVVVVVAVVMVVVIVVAVVDVAVVEVAVVAVIVVMAASAARSDSFSSFSVASIAGEHSSLLVEAATLPKDSMEVVPPPPPPLAENTTATTTRMVVSNELMPMKRTRLFSTSKVADAAVVDGGFVSTTRYPPVLSPGELLGPSYTGSRHEMNLIFFLFLNNCQFIVDAPEPRCPGATPRSSRDTHFCRFFLVGCIAATYVRNI